MTICFIKEYDNIKLWKSLQWWQKGISLPKTKIKMIYFFQKKSGFVTFYCIDKLDAKIRNLMICYEKNSYLMDWRTNWLLPIGSKIYPINLQVYVTKSTHNFLAKKVSLVCTKIIGSDFCNAYNFVKFWLDYVLQNIL